MTAKAARAYALARVSAAKSRLLRRADVLPLFCATDEATTRRALATFHLDPTAELHPQLRERLDPVYRMVLKAYPRHASLFRALRDREGANVLEERQASLALLAEAKKLAKRETLARALIECVIRERDNELLRRGARYHGVSEPVARGLTVLLREPRDPQELRAERRKLCRRAFIGHTFELAPAIALVLLAEEELRGVTALAERRGRESLDRAVERTLVAGLMAGVS